MTNRLQTAIVALTTLGGAFLLSLKPIEIKDATNHATAWWVTMNSISVQGEGKVFAQPDVFIVSLSTSNTAPTTSAAQQKTKQIADEIVKLAKDAGIDAKDIQTTEVSIYPEYNYLPNGTNKVTWYRATHGLTLKIRKLSAVDELMGKLTFDNSIQITTMSYDIDDKTTFYSQARKLAFEKAKQKAIELAALGEVNLDKPLSISDQVNYTPLYGPMPYQANVYRAEAAMDVSAWAPAPSINPGQLEVSVVVNLVYGVK